MDAIGFLEGCRDGGEGTAGQPVDGERVYLEHRGLPVAAEHVCWKKGSSVADLIMAGPAAAIRCAFIRRI